MNNFIEYAIKSGISLTVFYLFYWILLRKDTHFRLNRGVLLFSAVASMILPFIGSNLRVNPDTYKSLPVLNLEFSPSVSPGMIGNPGTYSISKIILILYLSGACAVFLRLVYQAIFLHAVSRLSDKTKKNGYTFLETNKDMVPFSYFNRIFIPSSKIDRESFENIIEHEKSHMAEWHFADLFIMEMICVLHWFNPVVWFYERSLKEVHEYLADEAVLKTGKDKGRYQALLVNQAIGGPVFILTNQFNQSLIKKRIAMMKKMKNSKAAQFKALFIVPLFAAMVVIFAMPPVNGQSVSNGSLTVTGNVTDRSTGKAVADAAVIIRGTTEGTITDQNGSYTLKVNQPDAELVVSQVGYRTQVLSVGKNPRINVLLEQDILALDFSHGNTLIHHENVKHEQNHADGTTHVLVEDLPSYPGGTEALQKFLTANLKYPETAKNNGIQGTVTVGYVIDENGDVTNVKILRGVSSEIDKEAIRLTLSIKGWKPALQNGKPISMMVTMPIDFSIE